MRYSILSSILPAVLVSAGLVAGAHAAPITVGGLTFDVTGFADAVSVVQGQAGDGTGSGAQQGDASTTFPGSGTGVTDQDLNTWVQVGRPANTNDPDPVIRVDFTDNTIVNGVGADIAFFVDGGVAAVSVFDSFSPGVTVFESTSFLAAFTNPSTAIGDYTGVMSVLTFDLSDLPGFGVDDGQLLSSLFLARRDNEGAILEVAALNSLGNLTPVPLPAALPLFGGALAVMGLLGWRRRQAVA